MKSSTQKKHEALMKIHSLLDGCSNYDLGKIAGEIVEIAESALSIPFRNCDIGSAKEQEQRFSEFCEMNMNQTGDCSNCPTYRYNTQCEFAWANMPYDTEKGQLK